jgi:RNA polymerase sigma-70 factor, ECF subfamily
VSENGRPDAPAAASRSYFSQMQAARAAAPARDPLDALLQRARAGDVDAFGGIVREHQRMVFSLALNVVRDRSVAEELAQDAFLQLYQHLDRLESAAHLLFWLRRTVVHRAIDHARRPSARMELGMDEVPVFGVSRQDRDPWLERQLRQLVAALPPRPRAVLTLRFQEDLDPMEIARLLDLPVNTVKSHLRRSLAVLRARAEHLREVQA